MQCTTAEIYLPSQLLYKFSRLLNILYGHLTWRNSLGKQEHLGLAQASGPEEQLVPGEQSGPRGRSTCSPELSGPCSSCHKYVAVRGEPWWSVDGSAVRRRVRLHPAMRGYKGFAHGRSHYPLSLSLSSGCRGSYRKPLVRKPPTRTRKEATLFTYSLLIKYIEATLFTLLIIMYVE